MLCSWLGHETERTQPSVGVSQSEPLSHMTGTKQVKINIVVLVEVPPESQGPLPLQKSR
jgi:hypothetical protein